MNVDTPNFFWQLATAAGALGSIGSVFTAIQAYYRSREVISFHREDKIYGKYDKFYGPKIFETPRHCYFIFQFCLFNERAKTLIKNIRCSFFYPMDQKWQSCEILKNFPNVDQPPDDWDFMPRTLPVGRKLMTLYSQRELPANSAHDFLLVLQAPGFQTHNIHNEDLDNIHATFVSHVCFGIRLEIETSNSNKFIFETDVWGDEPSRHPNLIKL